MELIELAIVITALFVALFLLFVALLRYSNKKLIERINSSGNSRNAGSNSSKGIEVRILKIQQKLAVLEKKVDSLFKSSGRRHKSAVETGIPIEEEVDDEKIIADLVKARKS